MNRPLMRRMNTNSLTKLPVVVLSTSGIGGQGMVKKHYLKLVCMLCMYLEWK